MVVRCVGTNTVVQGTWTNANFWCGIVIRWCRSLSRRRQLARVTHQLLGLDYGFLSLVRPVMDSEVQTQFTDTDIMVKLGESDTFNLPPGTVILR